MSDFLKEVLANRKIIEDDKYTNHTEGEHTIKNVPCRNVEGIGIVYKATVMSRVLTLLDYMKENNVYDLEY